MPEKKEEGEGDWLARILQRRIGGGWKAALPPLEKPKYMGFRPLQASK